MNGALHQHQECECCINKLFLPFIQNLLNKKEGDLNYIEKGERRRPFIGSGSTQPLDYKIIAFV